MGPRPFLKWAGGKRNLIPEILARFPPGYRDYYEPFLGGGAVFLALSPGGRIGGRTFLGDLNPDVAICWSVIRDSVDELIGQLRELANRTSREDYERVRDLAPQQPGYGPIEQAARTIYLNRLCFNGLYRVNQKGQFNVPYGKQKTPGVVDAPNLRVVSEALQGVSITNGHYAETLKQVGPGDLVYLDPPYVPTSATANYVGFCPNGFGPADQEELAATFDRCARAGATVLLSNSDTPEARYLYRRYRIDPIVARRSIAASGTKREPAREILVRHPNL
jgi:DNA adenine methylase